MQTSKHAELKNKLGTVVVVQDPEIGNATIDLINETGKQVELSVHLLGHKSRAATVEKMNEILLQKSNGIKRAEQDLLELQSEVAVTAEEIRQNADSLKELNATRDGMAKGREEVFASLNNNVKVNKELEEKIKGLELKLETVSAELAGKFESVVDLNAQKATVTKRIKELEADIEGQVAALLKDDKRIVVQNIAKNAGELLKAIDASRVSYAQAVSQTTNKEVKAQKQVKSLLGLSEDDNLGKTKFIKIKSICEKIIAKNEVSVELHDVQGAVDQAVAQERVLQIKAVIAADVLTAATKEKDKVDAEFKELEARRSSISHALASVEEAQLRNVTNAEKLRNEHKDAELKAISKAAELSTLKARYEGFKAQAIGVSRNESGLANLVSEFSQFAEVKTGDTLEIDQAAKRNHIVVVKSAAEAEAVMKVCGEKFIVQKVDHTGVKIDTVGFAAQVDALNMSRIFVEHQPTFEGDKKPEAQATANDNAKTISVAEKVLANSIALGEVVNDAKWTETFNGINRELAHGLRAVLVRSPLVKGAEGGPLLAVFPLSSEAMTKSILAGTTNFNIDHYNANVAADKMVQAVVIDDSVVMALDDERMATTKDWGASKGWATKAVGSVSGFGVYASR